MGCSGIFDENFSILPRGFNGFNQNNNYQINVLNQNNNAQYVNNVNYYQEDGYELKYKNGIYYRTKAEYWDEVYRRNLGKKKNNVISWLL